MRQKIYTLIIILLVCSNTYSIGFLMDFGDIRGVSTSYSFRTLYIGKSHLDDKSIKIHTIALSLAGGIHSEYGSDNTFGNIGFVIGFTPHITSPMDPTQNFYTKKGDRIFSLDHKGLFMIGMKIRFMGKIPIIENLSILSSYWYLELEGGALTPTFQTEKGAFAQYFEKKETETGAYFLFDVGIKFFIIDAFVGIGYLRDLYYEGYNYTHKEKDIANSPDETKHFIAQAGIGITLDLFAY